ncbi:MAG: hypothetical protein V9G04_14725 [Nocardioides sp.]|jgi:hypothetical protein
MNEQPDPLAVLRRESYDSQAVRAAQDNLTRDIVRQAPARRTRRRRIALGVIALGVAVPGVAAAAELAGVHTGWFGDPVKNTEDVDTSEVLNICSPDYPATIPGPPAEERPAGWDFVVADHREVGRSGPPQPRLSPRRHRRDDARNRHRLDVCLHAKCLWVGDARAAAAKGDDSRRERAGRELKTLANSELNHKIDGGGVVALDNAVADAVLAGDMADADLNSFYGANCEQQP